MSIRPLIFFPEELHSTLADGKRFGGAADNPAQRVGNRLHLSVALATYSPALGFPPLLHSSATGLEPP
jgi:hypothetical protein